jgi:hypothetical protein
MYEHNYVVLDDSCSVILMAGNPLESCLEELGGGYNLPLGALIEQAREQGSPK